MEKQISIIIPTYNMEAYIGKCLDRSEERRVGKECRL